MLDGLDLVAVGTDGCAEFGWNAVSHRGGKERCTLAVLMDKDNTCIAWSGAEAQRNRESGVKTDSGTTDSRSNRLLKPHGSSKANK